MWHSHKLKPISHVFSLVAAVMILDLITFWNQFWISGASVHLDYPGPPVWSHFMSCFQCTSHTFLLSVLLPIRHHSHLHAVVSEVCRPGVHPRFYEDLSENPWLVPRLRLHAVQHLNCPGNDTHQVGRGRHRVAGTDNSRSVPGPFHIFRGTNVYFSVNFLKMWDLII